MQRVIVADLDGTLLRTDKTLSPRTLDVLRRCREAGVPVVFATARSQLSVARLLPDCAPDVFIGHSGALVTAGERVLFRRGIPEDTARALIGAFLKAPEVGAIYAAGETLSLTNDRAFAALPISPHYRYTDFSSVPTAAFLKISANCADPAVIPNIARRFPSLTLVRYPGEDLHTFVHREAAKWPAVQAVSAFLGVPTVHFVAFGDGWIDVDMLRHCGTGVAVQNALPEVKEAADHICASNDLDGVALWIEANILT